jgi:hypothetical protein
MALGTNHITITSAANFIPEIWSDEIIATYKKNLVLANLVKKMSFKGKKGDTVHIPALSKLHPLKLRWLTPPLLKLLSPLTSIMSIRV